ncbi:hypothetical protein [Comamonas sp. JC664]|uniref:hypothetical protein n=1 Tax=Comamonas sp. JC664 TaxID=2801917 RepID=UPI00366B4990
MIASTPGARDTVLQQQVAGYQIWRYLKEHPEAKLYQMNLEDSLYYAPRPTWAMCLDRGATATTNTSVPSCCIINSSLRASLPW